MEVTAMYNWANAFERNKKWLYFALIATFIWGLAAHGYAFFDNNVSHDSLNEFHGAILGNNIKMNSGRVFVPVYRDLLRSDATLPWLIGILSLFWTGLAVFLVIRIFHVESKVIAFLIAGIFTTNISVSATAATYLHDLDCNMFSLMCAVAAVYLWKYVSCGWLWGTVLIALSLGIYQSFLFTAVVLVMIASILDLLNEETFQTVFFRGLKAIAMFLIGGLLYYLLMQVMIPLSGTYLMQGEYNSLDVMKLLTPAKFLKLSVSAYQDCLFRLINAYSSYPSIMVKGITALLFLICAAAVAIGLCNKKVRFPAKLLCVILILLLPLGMDMIHILTLGINHDLMVYAIWMFYLLVLLLADWMIVKHKETFRWSGKIVQVQRLLCIFLVAVLLYGNVQFANGMYLKKDLEYDAYLSLMTRVVARMESFDGYIAGETPVVFVGLPKTINSTIPGFLEYWNVTGMNSANVISTPVRSLFQAYFDYLLCTPLQLADAGVWNEALKWDSVDQMPCYPASDFIALSDGILIVKLGDVPAEPEKISWH